MGITKSKKQLMIFSLFLCMLLIHRTYAQTLTSEFDLYSPTTSTYTTNTQGTSESWYLDSNSREQGVNCRMVGMGYIFEGN